jgi:hypothetical protein
MSTEYPLLDLQSIPSLVSSTSYASFIARITPKIAKEILGDFNFDKQRPVNKHKFLELCSYMRGGTFQSFTSSINFSIEEGKPILTDGQHRIAAISETGETYPFNILATDIPAKEIYPVTDRGKPRSLADAIRSNSCSEKMGLSETATNKVAVGIKMIAHGYNVAQSRPRSFVSEKEILSLMEDYKTEANRIFEMADGLEYSAKLKGRLPMAMLLALYKNLSPSEYSKVDEFIYGCASNIGLKEGDVRRFVYKMYITFRRRGGSNVAKVSMSKSMEMSTLLLCWDYWYKEKTSLKAFSQKYLASHLRKSPNLAGTNITFSGSIFNPDD